MREGWRQRGCAEVWRGGGPRSGERWRGWLRGSSPAPPPRARGARAPRRPAFPRRVTSALRSHYPDYPGYPAPADGNGTGTGGRRHRPDAGHRFPREPDRAGAVPPRVPESEGRRERGGGRRQPSCLGAVPRLLESWRDGGAGVCAEWAGGPVGHRPGARPCAVGSLREAGRPAGRWLNNAGHGSVKSPRYPCGCDTDEGNGAGEKGCFPILDQPLVVGGSSLRARPWFRRLCLTKSPAPSCPDCRCPQNP